MERKSRDAEIGKAGKLLTSHSDDGAEPLYRVSQHHIRAFLANHHAGDAGIARRNRRQDGRIRNAQTIDSMHPQPIINHSHRVMSHPARPNHVVGDLPDTPEIIQDLHIGLDLRARFQFLRYRLRQRLRLNDLPCSANRQDRPPAVVVGVEKTKVDLGRRKRIGGPNVHAADTLGALHM